jgi:putative peptidoglycan lipid II flippase
VSIDWVLGSEVLGNKAESMSTIQRRIALIRKSGRTSLLMGLGVASKVAVDVVIASGFGLGTQTDAFFVACTLPLIFEALIYPACQSAFVPIFVRKMRPEQSSDQWTLFSALFNIGFLISVTLLVLGIVGVPWIASLLAPGVAPSTHDLMAHLTRILFLGVLFVGPVGVMRAFLNAHSLFTAPATLDLIRGMAILGATAVAYRSCGIEAVAWGFVIGGFLQFGVLAGVVIRKLGFGYRLTVGWRPLGSSRVGRLFAVPFADYVLIQMILVVERVIGSFMPAGSISAISYGHRLASVIGNLLFSGVEVVSLSALAADLTRGTAAHLRRARETFIIGLRLVWVLGIPTAVSIWFLSVPLVQLLFERGAFDRQDTLLAAPVLGLYALSIPFYGYWLLLKNYLFAAIQPRKILSLSCAVAGVNIGLALLLSKYIGARGVALASVGGVGVVYALGYLVLDREMGPFLRAMAPLVLKVAGASVTVGFVLYGISGQVSRLLGKVQDLSGFVVLLSSLAAAGASGAMLLLGILAALRVEEVTLLLKYLRGSGS